MIPGEFGRIGKEVDVYVENRMEESADRTVERDDKGERKKHLLLEKKGSGRGASETMYYAKTEVLQADGRDECRNESQREWLARYVVGNNKNG